jgi:hypothetical protein
MVTKFKEVRKLQGERVRMQFDDGREVVAMLLCATKDIDGSKHLIYDKVESVPGAETCVSGTTGCFYADANTLVNIELADAKKVARTLHGWDYVGMRHCA